MSIPAGIWPADPGAALERYYHWHAPIYDPTRWLFLFGRSALLRRLAAGPAPRHVLEVGCGTGRNLEALARQFPNAHLTGVDLSPAMLARAERKLHGCGARVRCLRNGFRAALPLDPPCDLVLFSYALTMMNPGWEEALRTAAAQLSAGGRIAVVDFAGTPWPWFRRWMACNHVRMEAHLLPGLRASFHSEFAEVRPAYGGVWRYLLFVGRAGGRESREPCWPGRSPESSLPAGVGLEGRCQLTSTAPELPGSTQIP